MRRLGCHLGLRFSRNLCQRSGRCGAFGLGRRSRGLTTRRCLTLNGIAFAQTLMDDLALSGQQNAMPANIAGALAIFGHQIRIFVINLDQVGRGAPELKCRERRLVLLHRYQHSRTHQILSRPQELSLGFLLSFRLGEGRWGLACANRIPAASGCVDDGFTACGAQRSLGFWGGNGLGSRWSRSPSFGSRSGDRAYAALESLDGRVETISLSNQQSKNVISLHHWIVTLTRRSLLIFKTTPAFRSATSLILYSAAVPRNCAISDGVSL